MYSWFFGMPNARVISIYDPNNVYNAKGQSAGTLASQVYLSFGNGGMSKYTTIDQLSQEFVEQEGQTLPT